MYTAKGHLDRNAMIKQYQPLVRRLAHHMMAKLPANVQVDDLIQVGLLGLSEALTRYEAAQGVQFETFATQRIRGAMLDELRENDWVSRSIRKSQYKNAGHIGAQIAVANHPDCPLREHGRFASARRGRYGYIAAS